jgi:hypothetical protein
VLADVRAVAVHVPAGEVAGGPGELATVFFSRRNKIRSHIYIYK